MPKYIFKYYVVSYFNLGNTASMISRKINIFLSRKQLIVGDVKKSYPISL